MGERVTDEILEEFAIVAEPAKVAGALKARYGDLVDRVVCSVPFANDADRAAYMEELRSS
jgi:hypothetical protein